MRLVDEDFEQTSMRLQNVSEKLEDACKLAEETERYSIHTTVVRSDRSSIRLLFVITISFSTKRLQYELV